MDPLFGLIGKKLVHSFSKKYFTEKFEREGIFGRYELFEIPTIDGLPDLLMAHPDLIGLNVTIPYKTEVIPFLDWLSPEAAAIGAVNTIKVLEGRLEGYNTDTYGFQLSLEKMLAGNTVSRALILGTGGAAKAVRFVLENKMNIPCESVSRNPRDSATISYESLKDADLNNWPLIVNTTPLGMYPNVEEAPDIPYEQLGADHFAYDLVYNPAETRFLRQAAAQGARVLSGMEMLILQAEGSWKIWNSPSDDR